jgi:hypothetical protein
MIYRTYPSVSFVDRLHHTESLDPASLRLTAEEAFARAGRQPPAFVILSTFDGRPAYMAGDTMIYADDGREPRAVDDAMIDRAAAVWTGLPVQTASKQRVVDVDQWTLAGELRELRPLYKYAWPDGQQVYVHGKTAEVVQYTTRASRFWAYLGAIPHWLYVPGLRTRDGKWFSTMVWSSLVGTLVAVMGLSIAIWMYSPRKRYRFAGAPTRIPYTGWKRWHTILGLVGGVTTVTWVFSGLLSLAPFGLVERLTALRYSREVQRDESRSVEAWTRVASVLQGPRRDLSVYADKSPAEVIESLRGFDVKALSYSSLASEPVYVATNGRGEDRIVPVHGEPRDGRDWSGLLERMRSAGGADIAEIRLLERYDAFYRDRTGRRPLPVIKVRMNPAGSLFYVDPKTASLVDSHYPREWVTRWLFDGLHSLDLPWLYTRRPLWDIVILTLLLTGIALCVTSLVLTARVLASKATLIAARLNGSRNAVAAAQPPEPSGPSTRPAAPA